MRVFKCMIAVLSSSVCLAFAEQFSRLYETVALCAKIGEQEYCHVRESGAVGVLNYKDVNGNILMIAAETSKYALVGDLTSRENKRGVVIQTGEYVDTEDGKHVAISISDANLWIFHDDCLVTKLWTGTKASFSSTYQFKEVSEDELKKRAGECSESESK